MQHCRRHVTMTTGASEQVKWQETVLFSTMYVCMMTCVYEFRCLPTTAHTWGWVQPVESALCFHHVGSEIQTQIVRLGGKNLEPLSHVTALCLFILCICVLVFMCVSASAGAHEYAGCMWKPQVSVSITSQSWFGEEFFTKPGAHWLSYTNWPASPRDPPASYGLSNGLTGVIVEASL